MGAEGSMPMNKPHLEFHRLDMFAGWATPEGYPEGIQQKILASDIDERRKMGSRTRLLRFAPGVYTTAPFVHDHWEEVYLLAGDLTVGNDAHGKGGEPFKAPTYACRPPGVRHGPFKSEDGCLLFEIHYYDESGR
jgi:ChrR-like protein with cupin domain